MGDWSHEWKDRYRCCRARSLMGDRAGCLMGIIGLSRPRAGCDVQAL
jgi:hypothetical protein